MTDKLLKPVAAIIMTLIAPGCNSTVHSIGLDSVYLVDRSNLSNVKIAVKIGITTPEALFVQFHSKLPLSGPQSPTPGGVYFHAYFCNDGITINEAFGNIELYKIALNPEKIFKNVYGSTLDLTHRNQVNTLQWWVDFNLRSDRRDICFRVSEPMMFYQLISNTVRIPRSEIDQALQNGLQKLPPLSGL